MLTVTRLLKPVIVTSHLLGGMSTLALLAVLVLRDLAPRRAQPTALPGGLRLLATLALLAIFIQIALGGWVSSNYAAAICADFPTCQGSWWPEMDTHHAFTLDRELGATASGALLSGAALTAIHWTHRLFAGLVLLLAGGFGLRLLARAETRAIRPMPAHRPAAADRPGHCQRAAATAPGPGRRPQHGGGPVAVRHPGRHFSGLPAQRSPPALSGGGLPQAAAGPALRACPVTAS
jgi:hypothetical protein